MKNIILSAFLICAVACGSIAAQSLAEAARKEAERRRLLAEQGIEARVIEGDARSRTAGGNVTTFKREPETRELPAHTREPRSRAPASTYRRQLQKLARQIAECEERQTLLQRQANAEKWSVSKVGRTGLRAGSQTPLEKLLKQIEELKTKIKSLRIERAEIYEAGKKAGYLPGELDGKGISP